MNAERLERYVTARAVADYMGMSVDWVLDKYQERLLPGYKFGRAVRFLLSEIDGAIASGRLDPRPR